MLKIINLWLPVLTCMGFIFYTSSMPADKIPYLFKHQDIAYHFLIYLILALCFTRAVKNTYKNISALKIILLTVIFGVIYGISDEWHQSFTLYRDVSGFDIFIDGLGSFIGSLVYQWLR